MIDKNSTGKLQLKLFGPFWLGTQNGEQIYIPSKKSRALLAILATSKNGECTKAWLQNKLWSRGSAKDSFRKELSNLRKILHEYNDNLLPKDVPRDIVKLNTKYLSTDLNSEYINELEFLEGLDISSEQEFEDWLRLKRASFECSIRNDDKPYQPSRPIVRDDKLPKILRLRIGVSAIVKISNLSELKPHEYIADDVLERIIKLLRNSGGIDIIDLREDSEVPSLVQPSISPNINALLTLKLTETYNNLVLAIRCTETATRRTVCSRSKGILNKEDPTKISINLEKIDELIIESTDEMLFSLTNSNYESLSENFLPTKLIHTAIENLFKVTPEGLDIARSNLDQAIGLEEDGVSYAWRAYMMTHYFDDPRIKDFKQAKEEGIYYAKRALELDPYNPLVMSLLTHFHSFGLKEFDKASELITKAKSIGSDHVMTHDVDALLYIYTGELQKAKQPALQAIKSSRFLPFRYCFMTTICMINGLEGNYEEAVKAGEQALALQSNDLEIAFPPTLRYLIASYKMLGEHEKAFNLVESLSKRNAVNSQNSIIKTEHVIPNLNIGNFLKNANK